MEAGGGLGVLLGIMAALLVLVGLWPRRRAGSERAGRDERPPPPRPAAPPAPFSGKAYVIDGDTIEVRRTRVRLYGVDAPELSQAGGRRARAHMIRLAAGREVAVLPVARDVYGRTVARVMLGPTDLAERMVLDGFAIATRRWCRDYVEAEEMARDTRQGLWLRDTIGGIGDPAIHRREAQGDGGPDGARDGGRDGGRDGAGRADAAPVPERAAQDCARAGGRRRGVVIEPDGKRARMNRQGSPAPALASNRTRTRIGEQTALRVRRNLEVPLVKGLTEI